MKRDELWQKTCSDIIRFMNNYHRRPSKYHPEERDMLHWMKYNKKQLAAGKMDAGRQRQFQRLLAVAEKFQRVNQYVYTRPENTEETELPFS